MGNDTPNNSVPQSTIPPERSAALLSDQARRWEQGDCIRVEAILDEHPELRGNTSLVLDLVCHEVVLRERRGDTPDRAEYLARFPELASELSLQFHIDGFVGHAAHPPNGAEGTLAEITSSPEQTGPHVPSEESSSRVPESNPRVNRYELGTELAHGGMGIVYRATDRVLEREVAVKLLTPRLRGTPAEHRFFEEARLTGRMQHPGIPPIHDVGMLLDGTPFLAMKLIRGRTLAEVLAARESGNSDISDLLPVFEHICQAVAFAHARGVIHRDIKPANVMVGEFGEVQVMDWGLAKERRGGERGTRNEAEDSSTCLQSDDGTQAGTVLGTPSYMAPEQARGETVDERADVFALGGVLCVILTGKSPNVGNSPAEVVQRAASGDVTDALTRLEHCGADPELIALTKRCLCPLASDRPTDAGAVANLIHDYRVGVEERLRKAESERAAAEVRAVEQRRKRRWQRAAGVAAFLVVGLVAAGLWWRDLQARNREAEERTQAARNEEAIGFLLERAGEALKKEDAELARTTLGDVRRRIDQLGGEKHRAVYERYWADTELLTALDRITDLAWTPAIQRAQQVEAMAELATALRQYGIVIGETPREEIVRRVNESLVRDRLLQAMDYWVMVNGGPELVAVMHLADPDTVRDAVRQYLLRGKSAPAEFGELDIDPATHQQPPRFASLLGMLGAIPSQSRESILRRALQTRPGDYGVLCALGRIGELEGKNTAEQREKWARAALAARPRSILAWNNLSSALRDKGELDEAVAAIRRSVEIDPNFAMGHANLGVVLNLKGDSAGSIAARRRAIELGLREGSVYIGLADSQKRLGQVDEAIANCREALRLDTQDVQSAALLGDLLRRKEDWAGATAAYKEAIRRDPKNANLHYLLGEVLGRSGDLIGSFAAYQQAWQLDPGLKTASGNLLSQGFGIGGPGKPTLAPPANDPVDADAYLRRGVAQLNRGELDDAIKCFREAVRLNPKSGNAQSHLALALSEKRDMTGAIAAAREGVRLAPKDFASHNNLGAMLVKQQEWDEASAAFREAIRLGPEGNITHLNLGFVLEQKKDIDGAIAIYREATRIDPNSSKAHNALGDLLFQTRDLAGAISAYRELVRLVPNSAHYHHKLGKALRDKGDFDGALAALRDAVRLDPKNDSALGDLGFVLFKKGDFAGAAGVYQDAVRLNPKDAVFQFNLGANLVKAGRADVGIAALREALRLDPDYTDAHKQLGVALLNRGEVDAAAGAFRAAARLAPNDGSVHFGLGWVLFKAKDHAGAAAAFREAARLDPTNAVAHHNLGFNLQQTGDLEGAILAYEESLRLDPKYEAAKKNLRLAKEQKAAREARIAPAPREVQK